MIFHAGPSTLSVRLAWLNPLDASAGQSATEQGFGMRLDSLEHLLGTHAIVRDSHRHDDGCLPGIEVTDFSNRDIEFAVGADP